MSTAHTSLPSIDARPGITTPSSFTVQRRLGDVIVELGFASRDQVEAAATLARERGRPTGEVLIDSGTVDPTQLARALAARNGLLYVDLNLFETDMGAANLIATREAQRCNGIPIAFVDDDTLLVATPNPANVVGFDDISMLTGYQLRVAVTPAEQFQGLISQLAGLSESVAEIAADEPAADEGEIAELEHSADDAPVIKLVHTIIADAVERGASDIHFDPKAGDMLVRFRVDGVVYDSTTVPRRLMAGVVSRVKIMAELDISERRVPQDGRMRLKVGGRQIDIRVATLPVMRGESLVLRILDKGHLVLELDGLGMDPGDRKLLASAVSRAHGAVVVSGPTGAGKTTTLYAALNEINAPDRTLISIEDPVEYELEGVKQVQVNTKAGLTFAAGLRSMIRSDPDVLMVGEIRDPETTQVAIESALTGHLVLSTLHTNDAPMAPARLIDMGIEPFLVASGIECVISQRLARRLCPECKQPVTLSAAELRESGVDPSAEEDIEVFEPGGCLNCKGTGYSGRIGIYEVMVMSREIRALILRRASGAEIAAAAVAGGMRRLRQDGIEKVRAGVTSVPELLRVLGT
jgi:type IV pilus assembly protein PilB